MNLEVPPNSRLEAAVQCPMISRALPKWLKYKHAGLENSIHKKLGYNGLIGFWTYWIKLQFRAIRYSRSSQ